MCLRQDDMRQSKSLSLLRFITSNIHWKRTARRLARGGEHKFSIKVWNFFPCLQRSKTKKGRLNVQ